MTNLGDTGSTLNRCLGINKDGTPCKARAQREVDYCLAHDPERVTDLAEWRRGGGQASSNASRARKALAGDLRDMSDVKARLMVALVKVEAGELEAGPANAMANLARAIVTVTEAAAVDSLQAEVNELRELIARRVSA